jgi:putative ABC transport system permease protein
VFGVALATTFMIAVGATTLRYTSMIKEMNMLFSGQLMVVSRDAIVIQAIPIGGGMLPQETIETNLERIEGVKESVPILLVTPMEIEGVVMPVPVNFSMGVSTDHWQSVLGSTPFKSDIGRFPQNESSREVIVGPSLADQYSWNIGEDIVINNQKLQITGILDTKIALLNRCIIMPLTLAQHIYNYPESVNIFAVTPSSNSLEKDLAETIEQEIAYVKALTGQERNDIIQPVLAQVENWNIGVHTIIFVMSLILVTTVMIMSVSERRRDFVTMHAIGAPLSYVLRTVIIEASLIGALGGVFGIVFGSISAIIMSSLYTDIPIAQFLPSILQIVPPIYMIEMFLAVISVCCLGGIIPAVSAARMKIAEVLKAEY